MRNLGRISLTTALLLALAACGGGDDDSSEAGDDTPEAGAETAAPPSAPSDDDVAVESGDVPTPDASADGDFAVPIAKFTAHGPETDNTIAPNCGTGNLDHGGDLFRFTPPEGWTWKSSSGGSGRDQIGVLGPDDVIITFTEAVTPNELSLVTDWEVVGTTGIDLDLGGESVPMSEVVIEGGTGYAIVDLPYLDPLPFLSDGMALGTAAVSSDTEGRPTIEEAQAILETVRVERCAALTQAMIWAAAGGFAPVPLFDPDPLGKTRPDEPQPATVGIPRLDAYSTEQIAYLMPVEESISICAAEAVQAAYADNPLGYLLALTPSGTQHDDLAALIADC